MGVKINEIGMYYCLFVTILVVSATNPNNAAD